MMKLTPLRLTKLQEFVASVTLGYGREQELRKSEPSCSNTWSEEFNPMKTLFVRFAKDESGATAIEYGLIATLIGVAIIAGASALGTALNTLFDDLSDEVGM
jgi:pilus assembly protein Flp/PilA